MQESLFDIFGTHKQVPSRHVNSRTLTTNLETLKRGDMKSKSASVSGFTSGKNALHDVGNRLKSVGSIQDSVKSKLPYHDQENSVAMPPPKASLHSTKLVTKSPIKNTSDFQTALRTPLSDIRLAPSAVKHPVQKSSKSIAISKEVDSLMSELVAIESCTPDDFEDWMIPDDFIDYNPIDTYEDIIPSSLRPTEGDIYRMVHFWEMYEKPELKCEPLSPVIPDSGDEFVNMLVPDSNLKQPLPVPLPFEDLED